MSDLTRLAADWDELARTDPLWAILTLPGTRAGRWDPAAFFDSGREEIERTLRWLRALPWRPPRGGLRGRPTGRALDFGCGVGRITQALAAEFAAVDGVDISPTMIEQAGRLLPPRLAGRCRFHLNQAEDLARFDAGSFDLVYSGYVLQHMPGDYARRYVAEFVRLLTPTGVAVFQVPVAHRAPPPPHPPLGAEGFRGEQELLAALPRRWRPGERLVVPVRIRNDCPLAWPTRGERLVWLGARWLPDDGSAPSGSESRAAIGRRELPPGMTATVDLELIAPTAPGRYLVEIGLLQEHVAWFSDRGVPATRVMVEVAGTPAEPAPTGGRMQMHVTPRDEVAEWITMSGGRLLGATGVLAAGREFFDADYEGATFAVQRRTPH